eukprot:CAMPEP_0119402902 /NCGR_PEP_ID=MMETSP1334-20130426/143115_1 /TAXON_ID=127549 /ORGANISM="Calcidiscus leptoporus, Strain RCC1130" /LENGTH=100 /DNA_ID=CAMNT_0007426841 /DNA_START=663 /DNA_END=966 /DNA_ORIENTATION=-
MSIKERDQLGGRLRFLGSRLHRLARFEAPNKRGSAELDAEEVHAPEECRREQVAGAIQREALSPRVQDENDDDAAAGGCCTLKYTIAEMPRAGVSTFAHK